VLALHGGPGPAGIAPLIDHLGPRRHVIAPTHPGWDGVPRPDTLDSVPALARRYVDLLRSRRIDELAVIGTSFGGWVAAEVVTQLVETGTPPRSLELVLIDSVGAAIDGYDLRPPRPSASPGRGPAPAAMAALAAYAPEGLCDPGLLPRLATARVHTLLIWGTEDRTAPLAYGRALAAALPAALLVEIEGAGHVPFRDHPAEVWAAVDTFLTATGRSDP
jgi:pimeloyl-ACP methyl ester carboxylesterase